MADHSRQYGEIYYNYIFMIYRWFFKRINITRKQLKNGFVYIYIYLFLRCVVRRYNDKHRSCAVQRLRTDQ
jgi:hypothetical protein